MSIEPNDENIQHIIELLRKDPSTIANIDIQSIYSLSQYETIVSHKTSKEIMNQVYDVLSKLIYAHSEKIVIYNSLKEYMYIDEIHQIKNGSFIRYIKKKSIPFFSNNDNDTYCVNNQDNHRGDNNSDMYNVDNTYNAINNEIPNANRNIESYKKVKVEKGGVVVNVIFKTTGVYILIRCTYNQKFIQIKYDENIIFQKLNADELLILMANDYIQSKNISHQQK
jgi:hypothetical protein